VLPQPTVLRDAAGYYHVTLTATLWAQAINQSISLLRPRQHNRIPQKERI